MANMGVVYDIKSLALRRVIYPDDDATLRDGTHALSPGEAIAISPVGDLNDAIAAIRLETGREPPTLAMVNALGL